MMQFGISNTPSLFIDFVNHQVFYSYLDWFIIVFIDDILTFLSNREEQVEHLRICFTNLETLVALC